MRSVPPSRSADPPILPLGEGDLDEVLGIEQASFRSPWSRGAFRAELEDPGAYLSGIRDRKAPHPLMGFINYRFIFDETHLYNLAVGSPWRQKGIGRRLLIHLLEHSRAEGKNFATLEVSALNRPALRLYQSFGFETWGRRKDYYGRGEDALILWLDLKAWADRASLGAR